MGRKWFENLDQIKSRFCLRLSLSKVIIIICIIIIITSKFLTITYKPSMIWSLHFLHHPVNFFSSSYLLSSARMAFSLFLEHLHRPCMLYPFPTCSVVPFSTHPPLPSIYKAKFRFQYKCHPSNKDHIILMLYTEVATEPLSVIKQFESSAWFLTLSNDVFI